MACSTSMALTTSRVLEDMWKDLGNAVGCMVILFYSFSYPVMRPLTLNEPRCGCASVASRMSVELATVVAIFISYHWEEIKLGILLRL